MREQSLDGKPFSGGNGYGFAEREGDSVFQSPDLRVKRIASGSNVHLLDLRTQSMLRSDLSPEDRARFDSLTTTLVHIRNQLATDTLTSAQRTDLITQEQQIIPARQALLALSDSLHIPSLDAVQEFKVQTSNDVGSLSGNTVFKISSCP